MGPFKLGLLLSCAALAHALGNDDLKLNKCGHPESQQWLLNPDGVHNFITRKADGFCIDVSNYGTEDGSKLYVYRCHPEDTAPTHQNQAFKMRDDGVIVELRTSKVVDRNNFGTTVGTEVYLWSETGADNQKWTYNSTDLTLRAIDSGLCLDAGGEVPAAPRPCDGEPAKSLPYCDTSLSLEERVNDLLARLTVEEKAKLSVNAASAVTRLGIPKYEWWSEALHGVAGSPGVSFGGSLPYATSFPQVCTTGAAFNRTLFSEIAKTISTEARAFSNQHRAGLTFWTPNVNVFRDPRWGRGQETPGEDPYLTSEYAATFVRGMQEGEDPNYIKASACCKHYSAYDFENDEKGDRHNFNAIVTDQDMADTFMPPFQACVERAHASSLMCSYNRINGVPACADGAIMTELARKQWGFYGYITSDCGAVDDVQYNHKYTNNSDDTCRVTLEAGMDIECGNFFTGSNHLVNAVSHGSVKQEVLDAAVRNQFLVQFRLGIFDPADKQPYLKIAPAQVNTPEAKQLALDAAREGMVLLKNSGALPLAAQSTQTLAVVGPHAADTDVMLGNYNGIPEHIVSVQEGLTSFVAKTEYSKGCDVKCTSTTGFAAAASLAQNSDATVIVIGIDQSVESEGRDRKNIELPGSQAKLVAQVASKAKGPVVVVVISGSSLDIQSIRDDPNVDAIIWAGYAGQSGGQAIADVIFGKYNPGGRLTTTIYPASYTSLSMRDMNMRPSADGKNPGRTYRFYTGTPVYTFGHGLSYTTFKYTTQQKSLRVPLAKVQYVLDEMRPGHYLRDDAREVSDVRIAVTNTGKVAGSDSVLLYVTPPNPGVGGNPLKYLVGFERVFLEPGQQVVLTFKVTAADLSLVNFKGVREASKGTWTLSAGSLSIPIVVA